MRTSPRTQTQKHWGNARIAGALGEHTNGGRPSVLSVRPSVLSYLYFLGSYLVLSVFFSPFSCLILLSVPPPSPPAPAPPADGRRQWRTCIASDVPMVYSIYRY